MSSKYQIKVGIIGGSGLNNPTIFKDSKELTIDTPYGSPSDVLIEGKISGVDCVLLARHGRQHTINPSNVNYRANIWALKSVGCTHVIVSTATGSLKEEIRPGDFVILNSFIDRTTSRKTTFYDGTNEYFSGVGHIPMEPAFCNATRKILYDVAVSLGLTVHPNGTAVTIEGPRFSTKAESHMFRCWGAHLVNMTLVPEVVLAKEAGLCYAAIAMATDYDCWKTSEVPVSVPEVLETFHKNVDNVTNVLVKAVEKINESNWDDIIDNLKETVNSSVMKPQKKQIQEMLNNVYHH
ncbi:S-methyl-5'-thioadenosine phosphorylase-like [Lycorma delicatula]|uniref:S-methyl-5'-thioadenosine phosphorylase-like n=1 Tax=Lycorma delicatula TaxID=130591 RepID=UPI003F514A73